MLAALLALLNAIVSYLGFPLILMGVIWGIRLEGRVDGHQTLFDEREKRDEIWHDDLTAWLTRVEAKLDRSIEMRSPRR